MNLDAYFDRIGYRSTRAPTLAVLRDIVFAHACSIPFENLNILLGSGISLDDDTIERKLIHERRGGYCFEQNSLLLRALTALGFSVTPLSARVRINQPPGIVPPRTHLFLRIDIDGVPWLADVGLGGTSPTGPLRLDTLDAEQFIPHEPRRIVREEGLPFPRYVHQAKLGETWTDLCEFTFEEMPIIDRELSNWWTSTHPQSRFRQNLLVGLARHDGTRFGLTNREFVHRRGADVLERWQITDADHLLVVLAERFGLLFPAGTRFGPPDRAWPT
jgi:N-hydroxyarylamine O-acetyltransferase